MKIDKLLKRYRVEGGKHFRLRDYAPALTHGSKSELKPLAKQLLADGVKELSRLQNILAAQDRRQGRKFFRPWTRREKMERSAMLCRGVKSGGRGRWSASKRRRTKNCTMSGRWRTTKAMTGRTKDIGKINCSYYEEVLVVRVHPQILENQKLPKPLVTKHIWEERFEDINCYECLPSTPENGLR